MVRWVRFPKRSPALKPVAVDPKPESLEAERLHWVTAKELRLSYYNKEALLFTMYPCYGNLRECP